MGVGSWELEAGSGELGVVSIQLSVGSLEMRVGSLDNYSFMNLNLLLRNPTYSSLYDLYV
jgi:hypothetical protein